MDNSRTFLDASVPKDAASSLRNLMQYYGKKEKSPRWPRIVLASLRDHGDISLAARAAGVTACAVRRRMRLSGRFKAAVNRAKWHALQTRKDEVEREIRRRAFGWAEPIYQGGVLVGHKMRYDTRLLLRQAEADNPKRWAPKRKKDSGPDQLPMMPADQRQLVADPEAREMICRLAEAMARKAQLPAPGPGPEIEV